MSKTNTDVSNKVNQASQKAEGVATNHWMLLLARCGYAAKGVVYLVIGILAVQLALGAGGAATDQRGALRTISEQPFGKFLLIIVLIGLLAFALWSFIQAIFDTDGEGKKAKGIIARLGFAAVGVTYALLGFGAFQLVSGSGNGGKSSTTAAQDWTATLLKQPFGQVLVILVGLVVLALACYTLYRAYTAQFQSRLNLATLSAQTRKWVIDIGKAGHAAQGIVFIIVGFFFIEAAFQHNASKAQGLDGALQTLSHQPYGQFLLAIVALGLIAYGVYSFVQARYRRLGRVWHTSPAHRERQYQH